MRQPRRVSATIVGLYAIAALLLANLLAMFCRSDSPALLSAALAQRQAPIAGGGGLFVMPAQLSGNSWGCYLMDVDRGALCVYQFYPGSKQLQFIASRNFSNDIKLANFNTTPSPQEVADLVEKQNQAIRGGAALAPDEEPSRDKP